MASAFGQSPHGPAMKINCGDCHMPDGWERMRKDMVFDHGKTLFRLEGRHETVDCKACHKTLVFDEADTECVSCHTDVHQQTAGQDCSRCHNSANWLVDNVTELHQDNGFPLLGAHAAADCFDCHKSESQLRFDRLGNDCFNCHAEDFRSAKNPDHEAAGYSKNCAECHDPGRFGWGSGSFNHGFFPLTKGHEIEDCAKCHLNGDYTNTPSDCIACHQADFQGASQPNHVQLAFGTDCRACHTTDPGWMPANFKDHDGLYFPIYSGEHEGEWNACTDCHTNPNDYGEFTCLTCHTNPGTDKDHQGVQGYVYQSEACLACHPNGDELIFDHNTTQFALTGAHTGVSCVDCHGSGFEGTPMNCDACHLTAFQEAADPDHQALGFPQQCDACHTTAPDWNPAKMPNHDAYYPLKGAHAQIADDCAACHQGSYTNTPNTCIGCHQQDFDGTVDPNHKALNFSTDCTSCHNESAWSPSTFDHDAQHFPIYSGKHEGEWAACTDCHTNPANYAEFTCITCHGNPETDNAHNGVAGYSYNSPSCLACHPTGSADDVFDHNQTGFPLTGAHTTTTCTECHANGYAGTPTECEACHLTDYNQSANPNHPSLGLPKDCASCHTTEPGWAPASFALHDSYYPLNGAHAAVANDCAGCHNGDYNNTPNTCAGCHLDDYNTTQDPNHVALQFSTDCASCHTEGAWVPSTFDHDAQYFPIYSGKHNGEWSQCTDCHANPGNYAEFTCITCHTNPDTDDEHQGVPGYSYTSTACLACHPTGSADEIFDHNTTGFLLEGGHANVDCQSCHASGYAGTPSQCDACHLPQFNQTANPNHAALGLSTDCASCHTTAPGWAPAQFADHQAYFALNGAHAAIANDCAACHNGNYNNTPNTCAGCHLDAFNGTTDPDHEAANFSTDCALCHAETGWSPAQFDHDGQYFPIYSGSHAGEWSQCAECHTNSADYSEFSCTGCHLNPETDNNHAGIPGYTYNSNSCFACHPLGNANDPFDHAKTNFPLTGAHTAVSCAECHANGYQGTPMNCDACHLEHFNQSTNPNHAALGFSMDCASCHTTAPGWSPAQFPDHNTYYVLDGAHALVANDCAACHNGDYNNTPNTCSGCHTEDYNLSANPNHQSLGLPMDCAMCHTTAPDWAPATFPIHDTYWPLVGAHAGIANDCAACHNGDYNNTPNTCYGCHAADYNGASNPNHVAAQFPTDCLTCHSQEAWSPATIDHNSFWPLTGAHEPIANDCNLCHQGNYNNTPNTCAGCHTNDYNQSTNPSHTSLGLPMDCAMCHTTDPDWMPATFPIHDTYWPLTGAHAGIANDCAACHNGNYNNTPSTCFGCHAAEYNATNNPNHNTVGFPTTCADCHTTSAWIPSTWDHDSQYFPIYSGKHQGEWNQCSDCHTVAGNYSVFSCIDCHEHDDPADMADKHQGVPGYSYNSQACYTCHPTGEK